MSAPAAIAVRAPGLRITLDPVEFRGFRYHTGVAFTLYGPGMSGELARGGRYVSQNDEPATGMSLYPDAVLRAEALLLAEAGIRRFKLYFMVGLPTETSEDVDDIAKLAIGLREALAAKTKNSGGLLSLQLSVNPFIPKPSTPFQWEPMLPRKELESKIDRLQNRIRKVPNLEMRAETPKESVLQALLSRGDRRVKRYLLESLERGGWKWIINDKHGIQGVPPPSFYVERRIDPGEILPWDIVDHRIDKKLLLREAKAAYLNEAG